MDIDLFESREFLKYSSSPRMISILFFHGSLILFSHLLSSLSCSRFSSYIHVVHCGLFVAFTFINMSQGWSRQLVSDFTVVVGICFLPGPPYVVLGQRMDHSSSSKPPGWWVGVFKGTGWCQVMLVKISLVWGSGQSCLLDLFLLFSAYCWDIVSSLSGIKILGRKLFHSDHPH